MINVWTILAILLLAVAVAGCASTSPRNEPSFELYSLDYHTPADPVLQAELEKIDADLREKLGMTSDQAAVGLLDLRTSPPASLNPESGCPRQQQASNWNKAGNPERLSPCHIAAPGDGRTPRLAMIHPDRGEYAASVPKIGILLAYFKLHPEAAQNLDAQTRHELGLMIKPSSNEMAAKFSREMGLKQIQQVLNDAGFYDEKRGGGIWVGKHYGRGGERYGDPVGDNSHAATVRQLLRYYLLLEQGNLVSPEASKVMREIFESPEIPHDRIKFVKALEGRDVQIIRKWGSWENWLHDSAIITGDRRHYILVGLTRHHRGDEYLEQLAKAVDDLIGAGR